MLTKSVSDTKSVSIEQFNKYIRIEKKKKNVLNLPVSIDDYGAHCWMLAVV